MFLLRKTFFVHLPRSRHLPFSWWLLMPWNTACIDHMPDLSQDKRAGKEMKTKWLSLLSKYSCYSWQLSHYSAGRIALDKQILAMMEHEIELKESPRAQNFRHWYTTTSWSVWLLTGKANSSGAASSKGNWLIQVKKTRVVRRKWEQLLCSLQIFFPPLSICHCKLITLG